MIFNKKAAYLAASALGISRPLVSFIIAKIEGKMLIKVGQFIINTEQICYLDLNFIPSRPTMEHAGKKLVRIDLTNNSSHSFANEDAEALRWYFNHPTSDVVDIKNLKG